MQTGQQELWNKRLEKLQDEIRSLREKLTTLKKEHHDLRKALKNNNKLFHSIPAGIILVQQGKIIDINETALDQLGYRAEEAIGHDFLDLVHPDSKAFVKNLHNKRVSGKRVSVEYETDLVTKNGENFCCDVRVDKIRFNGRMAVLLNVIGIEKRKQREKELTQSKKTEALITLASGLNRELSQALEDITKNVEYIKNFGDSENKALEKNLRNIESATSHIIHTLRTLSSLSETESDPSHAVSFDLKKTVKDAVSLINPKLKDLSETRKSKINLKTYVRSVSPVEGDPNEIRDVIVNLILNAVEAMPQGGDLYLTTEENAGEAHIYIQDSGVGIPDHLRDRVLDPFYTTKGKDRAGLGLSLSHAIVKRHKGEIEVTSQKDQGTIFDIKLPLAIQKQKVKPRPIKRKIKNAHILIIEDEGIVRELLSQLLVSKGHRVMTAVTGAEGLNKLKRKKFDLVIADSQAPDIRGRGFIQKVKKLNRELSVSLIAGHEAGDGFTHLKSSGVDLIINKPLDMNKVLKQVSDVLMFGPARE